MKPSITDITLVVDRSGSMQQRREDAEGGVNAFIQKQAEEPGEALLTLVQFDTEYEIVHRGIPIHEAPEYRLEPRGMTALLDAVGRAINETKIRIDELKKADRPGLVIFV
ncbi:MAG: VWA domain-containing protein, partial [Longimicrobiales bacterium]|nr:VWA domain-containing protein [Longimicrobiales bacterium]